MTVGVVTLWLSVLLLWPSPAASEWYAGFYGGAVFDGKVDLSQASTLSPGVTTSEVKTEPGYTVGVRGGYWFRTLPVGLGVDVFYMRADTETQSVPGFRNGTAVAVRSAASQTSATAVALDLLMLRFPLFLSERYPQGQVQPYLTAGPTFFFTRFKDTGGAVSPANQSQSETVVGVKIGAGVNVHISRIVGLFAEYRFTHFKADVTLRNAAMPASTETLERILDAHHLVGGVSFAF